MSAVKRFIPLANRVLVQKAEKEAATKSGILLAEAAKEAVNMGKVLAVGPGKMVEGKLMPMPCTVGQTVVIPEYGGMKLKLGGEEYIVYRDDDLVGIIEE
jgi:chaperonin GroES